MTKNQLIDNIVITALCGGFPLTSQQKLALHGLTIARIRAGMMLLCTGLADVVLDEEASIDDINRAVDVVRNARRELL